jgi:uncharacterized protein (TIGR00251 family)
MRRSEIAATIEGMAVLRIHIVPHANDDAVIGEHGDAIKIKLRAPAREGKANAALMRFLAGQLQLPRHAIVLQRGRRSRDKLVRIEGLSEPDARKLLLGESREKSTTTL